MMEDEMYPQFVSGFNDYSRISSAAVLGSVMKDSKLDSIQRILRNTMLSEKEKLLESIQLTCYKEGLPFSQGAYVQITEQYPRPRFLNPTAVVLAMNYGFDRNGVISIDRMYSIQDKLEAYEIDVLDLYRYTKIISSIQRGE